MAQGQEACSSSIAPLGSGLTGGEASTDWISFATRQDWLLALARAGGAWS